MSCAFPAYLMCVFLVNAEAQAQTGYSETINNLSVVTSKRDASVNATNQSATQVCETVDCKQAAARMLISMDLYSDPCDDFHQYACGNHVEDELSFAKSQRPIIEAYLTEHNEPSLWYLDVFRIFLESCVGYDMDFDLEEKIKFVKHYAGTNITGVFIDLILTQSLPLFEIGLDVGSNSLYQFQITAPGVKSSLKTHLEGWPLMESLKADCLKRQKYRTGKDLEDMYREFKKCVKELLKGRIRGYSKIWNVGSDDYSGHVNFGQFLDFLLKLEKLLPPLNEIHQKMSEQSYELMSINQLQEQFELINWKILFNGISKNRSFSGTEHIQVYFSEYLKNVFEFIETYNRSTLVSFLRQFYSLQLYGNLVIPKNPETRQDYCMDLSYQLMPDITTSIFYKTYQSHSMLQSWNNETIRMFNDLKDGLNSALESSRIDESSKALLQKKLERIQLGVIASGDVDSGNNVYVEVQMKKGNFMENVMILLRHYRRALFSIVENHASPASVLNYFISPLNTQPISFYNSDYIAFHPSIFFQRSMSLPRQTQLAKLGPHFGHEISKHFDTLGRLIGTGDEIQSSDHFYKFLKTQTNNLVDSTYLRSPYNVHGEAVSFQLNATPPVNQLIADNTAFRTIYDKFKLLDNEESMPWIHQRYSREQIFYITYAQEFCGGSDIEDFMIDLYEEGKFPPQVRIHNIISNSADFGMTFDCPEGSAMLLVDPNLITQFPYIDQQEYDEEEYEYPQ